MSDAFVGEIKMFGGTYAPNGYLMCLGQELSLVQNQALEAVIGTTFGGNPGSTFALPHFGGRMAIGQGQAPGIAQAFAVGASGGAENMTLSVSNMPTHSHQLGVSTSEAQTGVPSLSGILAVGVDAAGSPLNIYGSSTATTGAYLNPNSVQPSGNSQPFSLRNPYLAVAFIIAATGVFPRAS